MRKNYPQIGTHQIKAPGMVAAVIYTTRCPKCKCVRAVNYTGGRQAQCQTCSKSFPVEMLFPRAYDHKTVAKPTPEQEEAATREWARRMIVCERLAAEAFDEQPKPAQKTFEQILAELEPPTLDSVLHEMIVTKAGGLYTEAYTPDNIREGLQITSWQQYQSPRDLTL